MFQNNGRNTKTLILDSLDYIILSVEKYLDALPNSSLNEDSKLFQLRQKLAVKEIENIKLFLNEINPNQKKKKIFHKLEKVYTRIEALVADVIILIILRIFMVLNCLRLKPGLKFIYG